MQTVKPMNSDENIAKNLRKFTSAHTELLGWAGFQALQLKRVPANIRQNAFVVELAPRSHSESHRRYAPPLLFVLFIRSHESQIYHHSYPYRSSHVYP